VAPCYDIYVRLPRLDRLKVESFLDAHMANWRESHAWTSEDASEIVAAGFSGSPSGETLYSSATSGVRDPGLDFVIVSFPQDAGVVLGVSINLDQDEADALAEQWLVRLLDEVGARQGFVQAEQPPPLTEAEWQTEMERAYIARSV
jgi:hypothetical protein